MKMARIPVFYLAIGAGMLVFLAWVFTAVFDQAATRGAYQVWL